MPMPVDLKEFRTRVRIVNDEVFYADGRITNVSNHDIHSLATRALGNSRKRARLCTHKSIEDELHEMLIVHNKNAYIRPHKHLNKIESIHVIDGSADLVFFDDAGVINSISRMGDYGSGSVFYSRIEEPCYHCLLIRSQRFVFHEVTSGPFKREDTIFAPWAPEERDPLEATRFVEILTGRIEDTRNDCS